MITKDIRVKIEKDLKQLQPKANSIFISGVAYATKLNHQTVKSYIFGKATDLEIADRILTAAKNLQPTKN